MQILNNFESSFAVVTLLLFGSLVNKVSSSVWIDPVKCVDDPSSSLNNCGDDGICLLATRSLQWSPLDGYGPSQYQCHCHPYNTNGSCSSPLDDTGGK